jgi:hypothetical protein
VSPKKIRESHLLRQFLQIEGLSASAVHEHERPDFLAQIGGRTVGIEVTEVYIDDDGGPIRPRHAEAIVDGVVARAWQLYRDRGGQPVRVSFGFATRVVQQMRRDQTAEALAEFVLQLPLRPDEYRPLEPYGPNPWPTGVPELTFMNVLAVREWGMALWTVPRGGWMAPLDAARLQPVIDEKATKLSEYRKAAPETWLLIATDGIRPSQFFDASTDLAGVVFASPFDRTYYLAGFEGKVLRLA